jgi:hypothetical protein
LSTTFPTSPRSPATEPGADRLRGIWYSTEELAELLDVDASTVRRWRCAKPAQGPPFVRISARVTLYSARDVERWLEHRRIDPEEVT